MTIDRLLTFLTQIIFLFVAGSTMFNWAKYRTRARRDIALVFLSLALAILAQDLQRILPALAPVFTLIFLVALLIQPYLLLRLVQYFRPIPTWLQRVSLLGLVLVIASFSFSQMAPILVSILAVVYFFTLEGYATLLLTQEARTLRGVLGKRLQLASIGSGLLALIFFLSLGLALIRARVNLPATSQPWVGSLFQLLAILSGLSYYFGFSTPRWIRQNWQFRELYHFLRDTSKKLERDRLTVFEELAAGALRTVGGATALIAGWNPVENRLMIEVPGEFPWQSESLETEVGAIRQAWQKKQAYLAHVPEEVGPDTNLWANQFGAHTLFIIPIVGSLHPWGMLIIALRYEPLFEQDDLDLLTLLAGETAGSLDKFALIDELKIMNQFLEQRVAERTSQLEAEILERQRAEAGLRGSENRFRSIVEAAPSAMISVDHAGRINLVNIRARELFGYSKEELLGRPVEILVPERLRNRHLVDRQGFLIQPTSRPMGVGRELFGVRKDGREIPIEIGLSPYESADGLAVLALIVDISERKQAQAQNTYHARLLRHINDAVIATDPSFNITAWNRAAEKTYGWTAAEVMGRNAAEIMSSGLTEQQRAQAIEQLKHETASRSEIIHHRKNGQAISVEANTIALTDESGKLIGYVSVNRDITERKQAEEQIHFQANLVANVSDAIIAVDMQLNIQSWNAGAEVMYGWKAEEVIGRPAREVLETDFLETTREIVTKQVIEKGYWVGDVLQLHRDGTRIPAFSSLSLYKDPEGKPAGIVAVNRDTTERKQAEERFHLAVESAPNAIILVDQDGKISLANSQTEKFFGYARTELIGLNVDHLVPVRFRNRHARQRDGFLTDPQTRPIGMGRDLCGVRKDGSEFPVEIGLTPIETRDGRLIMATIVDITERKHAEEKLRQQNQRLRALREIDTAILSSDSLENIVGTALSHIRELIECQRATLTLIDSTANEALLFDVRTAYETFVPQGTRIPLASFQDIIQILSQNQPVLINDLNALTDPQPQIQSLIQEGLRSLCILPLFSQGQLIGTFGISSELPAFFDEEKLNLGHEVANQVAIAITQNNLLKALREINTELEQRVARRTAELSEANTLLKAMLDNIPDQIYFKDMHSRFIRNSRSQARLMGVKDPSEVVGKTDFDFFPHAQRAFEEEQELMKAGKPLIDLEEFVVWPDGRNMWVSTTKVPLRDQVGQIIGILGISRDITERKRFEENIQKLNQELENNQKDIQSILDSMSTLNAKVALDGRLLFVNKIATQASGLSVEELMKTNFLEGPWWTFDPKVHARVKEAFAQACSGMVISYDEKIFVFGQILTISFSLTPMFGADGSVEYILAEGRDISKLKEVEESLRVKTTQLESANKELESFAYSVSHDLRAPLRAINGFSQALSNKYTDLLGEQGLHYLSRIQANTFHMGQLIDDLLSLSRISRREMKLDDINLTELAREVDKELRAQEPERQVMFEVEGQLEAKGDAGLIRIVLQNLLTNAWKFTSTRREGQAHIQFGVLPSPQPLSEGQVQGELVYYVRDNGVGFDMAFANKLFGAFQRLHSTAEFPGTGIGLATVQRVIHRHGGRIWAEAELEKGATFYFTLGGNHEG
jgi:PAS domain S-box-containing protein